jgi:hypothetical protein
MDNVTAVTDCEGGRWCEGSLFVCFCGEQFMAAMNYLCDGFYVEEEIPTDFIWAGFNPHFKPAQGHTLLSCPACKP